MRSVLDRCTFLKMGPIPASFLYIRLFNTTDTETTTALGCTDFKDLKPLSKISPPVYAR